MRTALAMAALAALLSWWAASLETKDAPAGGDSSGGGLTAVRHGGSGTRSDAVSESAGKSRPGGPSDPKGDGGNHNEAADAPGAGGTAPANASPPAVPALFRNAAPPPPPPQSQARQPGEHFTLTGLVGRGDGVTIFLRDQVDGRVWTAPQGGHVAAWTVAAVTGSCVELKAGRRKLRVCM